MSDDLVKRLLETGKQAAALIKAMEQSFDLRREADMRAIKMWQESNPGNDLTWPDHADLCVWLMEKVKQAADRIEELEKALARIAKHDLQAVAMDALKPGERIEDKFGETK